MNYSKKVKTHVFPWGGRFVYTPFGSHDMVSIVGSVVGGTLSAQSFLRSPLGTTFAETHAAMLLEGTTKHSKQDIQVMLDSIGASLSFVTTADRLVFRASVRPIHIDTLLKLIIEVLLGPTFPSKELVLLKQRTHAELNLESQDPKAQSHIALARAIFPPGHASYEESTAESMEILSSITSKQLRAYHTYSMNRQSLIISIAGDISFTNAQHAVAKCFKKLPDAIAPTIQYLASTPSPKQSLVTLIPDKTSAEYAMGIATGITNTHPDYPALVLGMQILGNAGFTGRLMQTVREKEGLTYGAYASVSASAQSDGMCSIKSSFAPQSYDAGRASIMRQIKLILDTGVSSLEVRKHTRMYGARSYVAISNSGACAMIAHRLIADDKSPAYFDQFIKEYLKLTAREVNKALRKYLVIENLSESVAGTIDYKPKEGSLGN
jgi:zinc protease